MAEFTLPDNPKGKTIDSLTANSGNIATDDLFAVKDVSASATKKVTMAQVKTSMGVDTLQTQVATLNTNTADTGWVNVIGSSMNSNAVAPTAGSQIRYRKKSGVVYLQGTFGVTNKASVDALLILTLPTGSRPSGSFYTTNTGTGYVMSRFYISSTGAVNLEWVRRVVDGVEITGAIAWVGIDVCFPVD